jgi:GT2 family glycosyltransferase
MPEAPRVSVVMATRNRRDSALTSLRRLVQLPDRPEVILVDNASEDGTPEAVSAALPQVRVLRSGRNLGAVGRTLGVEAASAPWVAFADDDSWWAPGALSAAAQLFEAHPRLGLAAGTILVGPEEQVDPVSLEMASSPLPAPEGLPGTSILGFVACGAVVRRQAYLQVGGFSPVIFFLGEETLLAQDLAAAGWQLVHAPELGVHHHPEPAAAGRQGRRRLQLRNALLSTWLRRPGPVVVSETAALLRDWADADSRGALLDAVGRLPLVLRHRRVVPAELERQIRMLEAHRAS